MTSLKRVRYSTALRAFLEFYSKKKENLNITRINPHILDSTWTPVSLEHQYHLKESDFILREINEQKIYLGIESFKDNGMNEGFLHLSLQF